MTAALKAVTIFTDGACEPNPGPGGWAALIRTAEGERVLSGRAAHTTNNRMELTAAVQALDGLAEPSRVTLYTDSQYLQRGVTEWMAKWQARNWRSTSGSVANQDLWKDLLAVLERHQVEWRWLRGHSGQAENSLVDRMARQAIRRR